ncbi:MAG TPA: tetratricopeptide repeat protein, partial [Bryobacteraceae bacterium]|nr:tetratricopeptide repeat protein [Bryobacteraceae bacterium]
MRLTLRLLLFLVSFVPELAGEEHWIRLTTPHFELYSTASEKKAREALLFFEQVRSFFLETSGSKKAPEFPVRIIAFNSEKQYAPYRARSTAFAYYTSSRMRDYIVMQDASGEHYPVALHEYTHLVLRHTGLKLPPWINEGWAEVYSSLKPTGKQVAIGAILPGHIQQLRNNRWIPLSTLTRVDQNSPLYNERDRVGLFYAESWALVHMLMLWPEYKPKFGDFAVAIGSGQSFEDACQSVYGKTAEKVEQDLHSYFEHQALYGALFDVKLEKSAEQPEQAEVSPFDSKLMLADLLAVIQKTAEATTAYRELLKTDPRRPELNESLGYLAWQNGETPAAIEYFGKAFEAGTTDPQMCFHYAVLRHNNGAPAADILPALRRAVELKPNYAEARMELGMSLMEARDYAGAIDALSGIKTVTGEQAPHYFAARAYAALETGNREDAKKFAEFAKRYARTPAQREQADSILRYVHPDPQQKEVKMRAVDEWAREHPPVLRHSDLPPAEEPRLWAPEMKKAEGLAVRLECNSANKRARLAVLVEGQEKIFDIEDPSAIQLRHPGQSTHEFQCGPQDSLRMTIEYVEVDGK